MIKIIFAYFAYTCLILFMIGSSIWVTWNARKNNIAWGESLAWGLLSLTFIGIGPILYVYWRNNISTNK